MSRFGGSKSMWLLPKRKPLRNSRPPMIFRRLLNLQLPNILARTLIFVKGKSLITIPTLASTSKACDTDLLKVEEENEVEEKEKEEEKENEKEGGEKGGTSPLSP